MEVRIIEKVKNNFYIHKGIKYFFYEHFFNGLYYYLLIADKEAYEGTYLCEVSGEAPFPTDYAVVNITVAILPQNGPFLKGIKENYQVGDYLEADCISGISFPASELQFFINGEKVLNKI